MDSPHQKHFRKTANLAKALKPRDVYRWIATEGYFPEPYVVPPCFVVTAYPAFRKQYFTYTARKFTPKISEVQQVHFPKTDFTDRTFGIIDPEIHSDIANTITLNWKAIVGTIFHKQNKVCAYSFPIPLDSKKRGFTGKLRSGRMIYEFIKMAENDIAAISYKYKYLFKTDVKNFYSSIYTHSIPWALHGKKFIENLPTVTTTRISAID